MSTHPQYLAMLVLVASIPAMAEYTFTPFKRELASTTAENPPLADYSLPFTRKVPRSLHKKNLLSRLTGETYFASFTGASDDNEYVTAITVGGQEFEIIVDGGSSDTWVPAKGFLCFDSSGDQQPEDACGFGSTFDPSESTTYQAIPDMNINVAYGTGSQLLTGTVAEETVTVGGMTVQKQTIGIGTNFTWVGDDVTSGIMGLGLPDLTSVFNGSDPAEDNVATNKVVYNPLFFTALAEGIVTEPYWSMSLNRGSSAAETNSTEDPTDLGSVAFGGIVDVAVTDTTVTVPIQGFVATGTSETDYFWYTIDVDSYNYPGAPTISGAGLTPIVDSGTSYALLPAEIVEGYLGAMDPPGFISEEYGGAYVMDCDATAPPFSLTISGQSFSVSPKDIFLPIGVTLNGSALCVSGIQVGGYPPPIPVDNQTLYVLGQPFLHNVVATYNVKAPSLTLTERQAY